MLTKSAAASERSGAGRRSKSPLQRRAQPLLIELRVGAPGRASAAGCSRRRRSPAGTSRACGAPAGGSMSSAPEAALPEAGDAVFHEQLAGRDVGEARVVGAQIGEMRAAIFEAEADGGRLAADRRGAPPTAPLSRALRKVEQAGASSPDRGRRSRGCRAATSHLRFRSIASATVARASAPPQKRLERERAGRSPDDGGGCGAPWRIFLERLFRKAVKVGEAGKIGDRARRCATIAGRR